MQNDFLGANKVTVNLLLIFPVLLHQWSKARMPEVQDQLIDKGAWPDKSRRSHPTRHLWQCLVYVLGVCCFVIMVNLQSIKKGKHLRQNKEHKRKRPSKFRNGAAPGYTRLTRKSTVGQYSSNLVSEKSKMQTVCKIKYKAKKTTAATRRRMQRVLSVSRKVRILGEIQRIVATEHPTTEPILYIRYEYSRYSDEYSNLNH